MPLNQHTLIQLRDSLETIIDQPTPQAEAAFRACFEAVRDDLDAVDAAASDDLETALHVIQQIIHQGQPPTLPAPLAQHEGWPAILAEIDALQKFVLALAQGDLEQSLAYQGLMAGGLKTLQANLRHLTWQTQQIAKGDFEQRVDFMGEFSEAFNAMVSALKESQACIERYERELREANAELQRRVTERQQTEASLRESNANLRSEIAERKRIETQIRESEARYRLLAENMADVVWVLKTDTMTFSYVSPSVEKLRGYTPEEVFQQSIDQVITPDSLAHVEADLPGRIERFLRGDPDVVTQIDEIEQWRKDGSTVWTEVATTLVLTPAGTIDVVGVSRDITERRRAGRQLRESEERFRLAFDEASVGMCFVSLDGHLMRVNQRMGEIFGYAPEALEGLHVNDITLPDDWDISPTYIDQAISGGEPRAMFEKRYRHKDGHLIWGRVISAMVRDADGEPQHFISHVQDITKQKRAEEELRQSEQRFAAVMNSMEALVYVANMNTYELLFINQYMRNIFRDVEGQLCWQVIQEGQLGPCEFCTNARLLDDQGQPTGIYTWEFQNTRTERWYQIQDQAIRWTDGRLVRLEVATDITERKKIETQIRESEARYRLLAENMADVVWVVETNTMTFSYVSPSVEKLRGYTPEEVLQQSMEQVMAPNSLARINADLPDRIKRFLQGDPNAVTQIDEIEQWRKDGSTVWTEVATTLVLTPEGTVNVVGVSRDITERRRIFKAMRQARDEAEAARRAAEAANQAKSTFLANMSHELRTPMNAVLGFAELMSTDTNLNETQREHLAIIRRSGDHLLALINDVLDLSKIEAGRIEIRPTDFDLHIMLQSLSEMFSLRAEKKGLTVTFDIAPDVPRHIHADEGKLRQVLINLLGNAVKFTASGGITMNVRYHHRASDTALLHIEVKDTGVGIAPEELVEVFKTFVQTESGRQTQTGTGLGLPISREYVRMMGGDLIVESEVGVGSKFEFDIPVEVIDPEVTKRQRQQRVVGLAEGQPAYKILVAEDQIDSQTLMLSLLERAGFEVQVAANGKEAVERWQTWHPDLIFMDIRMPEQDGLAATRQIKTMPGGDETVIVAVTASAFEEDRIAILAEGGDDFLRKPYREADIFDIIARHLDVIYIYGPPPDQPTGPEHAPQALDVQTMNLTMADLPDNWRADIQRAAIEVDLEWLINLTEEIQASHPRLAKQLLQWIHDFQYEEILTLIERLNHTDE